MGGFIVEDDKECGGTRGIKHVIDDIGFGVAQILICFIGGAIWAADGSELLIIGSVTRSVSGEWGLGSWQRGFLSSLVFCGVLVGNSISGPSGDTFGRRMPVLVSFLGIAMFSVLSASATYYYMLLMIRMMLGVSFGFGQPSYNTLLNELVPGKWRVKMNSMAQSMFAVGELYAAMLIWWSDPSMKHLDWRWLCVMGAIPSAVGFVLCWLLLYESPSFLASKGKEQEARAVLESIKSLNKADHVSTDFECQISPEVNAVGYIYSRELISTTATMIYSCFVLNLVLYGSLYALPQVMTEVDMGYGPAVGLIVGSLWELVGYVASGLLGGGGLDSKKLVLVYLIATALSLISFTLGANREGIVGGTLLQGGYLGLKIMVNVGFVAVYLMCAQVYPVATRNTGVAACIAGGRVGSILAPILFEKIAEVGGWQTYFMIMASALVVNCVPMYFLDTDSDPEEKFRESMPLNDEKLKSETSAF
eukprot:TRINITY_DN93467_c0_g1_i1.p1 TRINITY_DN93467_c0_g1~~TRINITY_DN93467_c0_g1_i1.p1  ORF type:complete len:477 (-),score=70.43 TRINITY_DN93467_c0_g1_i1:146-1576(-)